LVRTHGHEHLGASILRREAEKKSARNILGFERLAELRGMTVPSDQREAGKNRVAWLKQLPLRETVANAAGTLIAAGVVTVGGVILAVLPSVRRAIMDFARWTWTHILQAVVPLWAPVAVLAIAVAAYVLSKRWQASIHRVVAHDDRAGSADRALTPPQENIFARDLGVILRRSGSSAAGELGIASGAVYGHLRQQATDTNMLPYLLSTLLTEYVGAQVQQAATALGRVVSGEISGNPEDLFVDFYQKYQKMAYSLAQLAQASRYDLSQNGNFKLWVQFDRDFLPAIHDLLARVNSPKLNQGVLNYMWPPGGVRNYDQYNLQPSKVSAASSPDSVTSDNTIAGALRPLKGRIVSLAVRGKQLGDPIFESHLSDDREARIEEVTGQFVKLHLIDAGRTVSEPLENVVLSEDTRKNRPSLLIRPPWHR
jgi:hypothetical protein